MSYDENDAMRDAFLEQLSEELYEEHAETAIEEFRDQRLKSYYLANPEVAQSSLRTLAEARGLHDSELYSPAFVFASIATEVALRSVVLKPVVYGLVNSDSAAQFIADLTMGHMGFDRFRDLLFQILDEHAMIDLSTFRREGAQSNLWAELKDLRVTRNRIVHRAEQASREESERAVLVAEAVLNVVLPTIIEGIGLYLAPEDGTIRSHRGPTLFELFEH